MRAKLQEYFTSTKVARTQVAKGLDISPSALSLYLSGKYKGDNRGIDVKVAGFLEREQERKTKAEIDPVFEFVMTRQAKMVHSVLRDCHIDGDMGVIVSRAGLGKTTALREYAKANKDVILVTALVTVNTRVLLMQILNGLLRHSGGSNDTMARAIINLLRGSHRMIIIDEAQFLTPKLLEILRQIHDEAGIGLVYAGMPCLYEKMKGGGSGRLEQIYSRVGVRTTLPEQSKEDVSLLLAATGIKVSERVVGHLTEVCAGSARSMTKMFISACKRVKGNEITVKDIDAAKRRMLVL